MVTLLSPRSLSFDFAWGPLASRPSLATGKHLSAGGLDGWAWNEITALSLSCFVGLALVLRSIETAGAWPESLPDAYVAFPTVTGSHLRGSARPTFSLWCPVFGLLSGSGINKAGFCSSVPVSVCGAGGKGLLRGRLILQVSGY